MSASVFLGTTGPRVTPDSLEIPLSLSLVEFAPPLLTSVQADVN